MPQKRRPPRPVRRIDPAALAEFQAGIRKRYSDEEILEQLRASAERLGRSPTMREFEDDPETTVHPQTVIQHFKSWNEAKRKAGLVPRRFAEPADLIRLLRELGDELGRPPTAKDLDEHRASMASTCRWGRRDSSGRSTRACTSRSSSAACRSSPIGSRRGARTRA